jgi:hypothetical protein
MTERRLPRVLPRLAAEFMVVVVGVFVALWADSWADDRKQSAARTELLASLESEVRANMMALDTAAKYDGLTVEAMRRLMAIHDGTEPVPGPDSLETLLGWANSFRRAAQHGLSFGAYDAMIATGTSHLLPSREIGERLARHRFALASGQGDESLAERALEHMLIVMRAHGGLLAFSPRRISRGGASRTGSASATTRVSCGTPRLPTRCSRGSCTRATSCHSIAGRSPNSRRLTRCFGSRSGEGWYRD